MNKQGSDAGYPGVAQVIRRGLINILLNNDGSTTRLLETLIGDKVTVRVYQQGFLPKKDIPLEPIQFFEKGDEFLYRIVSLTYQGEPISNNVVVAPKCALDLKILQGLLKGRIPLGKLITETEHRREFIAAKMIHSSEVQDLFFSFKLEDGFFPNKRYLIIKNGESWFYICEVFHDKTIMKYLKRITSMNAVSK